MIPILILTVSTLAVGIIGSLADYHRSAVDLHDLYMWGVKLLGKAITVVIIVNAVWIGLKSVGLLK